MDTTDDAKALAALLKEQQLYNEYEFLSGAYNELREAHQHAVMALKKDPFSATYLSQRDNTKHDIDALTPIIQELGYNLMDTLQGKFQIQLKFLKRPGAANKTRILKT